MVYLLTQETCAIEQNSSNRQIYCGWQREDSFDIYYIVNIIPAV